MAGEQGALGALGALGNIGNADLTGGGGIFGDVPSTLNAITSGITNLGQIDMIGLITIGFALLMFFVALAGMMDQMSKRNRGK